MPIRNPEHSLASHNRDALVQVAYALRADTHATTQEYGAFLDQQPLPLVPRGTRETLSAMDGTSLWVNRSLRFQEGDDHPPEIGDGSAPLSGLLSGHAVAWVQNPGTRVWTPLRLRGEWVEVVRSLEPGRPEPGGLPAATRRLLAMAKVLVSREHETEGVARWSQVCQSAQASYRAHGYAVLRDLIDPLALGALRAYYRTLVAAGQLTLGDALVRGRYCLHSEVFARFLHPQLGDLVTRITGEAVKPSYVYFASYQPGASLARHLDREQCEFSISLLADYAPETDGPCGWPLLMENPASPGLVHSVDLGVGDGVLYRGRELVHFRDPLPSGHQSTSMFLHYVRPDFEGRLW